MERFLQRGAGNEPEKEQKETYTHSSFHMCKHGIAYPSRECAASRIVISLMQSGRTRKVVLESPAYLEPKGRGDNSLPRTQCVAENVYATVLQDSRDMGKTGLFETRISNRDDGFPIATTFLSDATVCSEFRLSLAATS